MTDTPGPEKDAFDDLLAAGTPPVSTEAWRQALFLRTTGVLRRRRWLKRAGFAAALAACYLAGLATMRLGTPSSSRIDDQAHVSPGSGANRQAVAPSGPSPAAASTVSQLSRAEPSVPADVLERWAPAVSEEKPAELYRRVGDRYLKEEGDVQAALRCYARSLENGTEEDLTPASEDDFLLMALKDARQKEKRHANDGG